MRPQFLSRLALSSAAVLLVSSPALAGKGRVALHPVVVIAGSAPESAAAAMTQALVDELKAADLEPIIVQDVLGAAAAPAVVSRPRSDAAAEQKLAEGKKALQKLQLPKAITLLDTAVAGFKGDDKHMAEAALLLAEAHYRRGDEAKGRKALEIVARVAPHTRLDAKTYPPVFISAFKEVRSRSAKESKVSPAAPKAAEALASDAASVRDVRAGIVANQCDVELRSRALAMARAPAADLVVVLGIANGERFFTVGGFVGEPRSGRWAALPVLKLDAGMLSADIEAGKLARELVAQAKRFMPGKVDGTVMFVDGVVAPVAPLAVGAASPAGPAGPAPLAAPDRRPLNDTATFATFAPPTQQEPGPLTRTSASEQLDRDSALAADLAALDGYDSQPTYNAMPMATTAEVQRGGITSKWWFWTAIGVGAAIVGGTTYYLMSRDHQGDTLQVQAAW